MSNRLLYYPRPPPVRQAPFDRTGSRLARWNIATGVVMLASSLSLFVVTAGTGTLPLYAVYPDPDARQPGVGWSLEPLRISKTTPGYYSAVFLLLSACNHLAVGTVFRSAYERCIRQGINPFRWAEYSFSASIMHVMIGQLSGVLDIHLLLAIGALTAVTMVFGYLQEAMNQLYRDSPAQKSFVPFWMGMLPHLANWSIIASYFFYSVAHGDPPGFVWAILFIIVVLDASFAVNLYLQQKGIGPWKDYVYGEMGFIILSLTSKQLLAWINFGGTQGL